MDLLGQWYASLNFEYFKIAFPIDFPILTVWPVCKSTWSPYNLNSLCQANAWKQSHLLICFFPD